MDLSSSTTDCSVPGSPSSANPGALRLTVASAALPRPAAPAFGNDEFGALANEVCEHLSGLARLDDGAVRHAKDQVWRGCAAAHVAGALLAVFAHAVRAVVVVEQGGDLAVYPQDDGRSAPAVATVGPA